MSEETPRSNPDEGEKPQIERESAADILPQFNLGILRSGDTVLLDCLSSSGEPCQTTLAVRSSEIVPSIERPVITVNVLRNTSQSPLMATPEAEYTIGLFPIGTKPDSLMIGERLGLLDEEGNQVNTSKVADVTIFRDQDGDAQILKPFDNF